ncbi:hypothetical protein GCM10011506_38400 [Marivirga lumbricoides]|uniref:DNA topoisomerase IV n=1 Tax=Marivirga lumbricoides TaxID=1046115 RepID=A0ABQ1MY34_9BACT|nr:hypothetical protein GCM10011506_38400 [Marivirga lumbricoides]
MNKLVIMFLLFTFAFKANAQDDLKCKKFHTGKFKVEGDENTIIIRNRNYQIEENNNVKIKDKINWLDECTYQLITKKVVKDNEGIMENDILTFQIIETGEDFYIVKITSDRRDFSVEAKVIMLK